MLHTKHYNLDLAASFNKVNIPCILHGSYLHHSEFPECIDCTRRSPLSVVRMTPALSQGLPPLLFSDWIRREPLLCLGNTEAWRSALPRSARYISVVVTRTMMTMMMIMTSVKRKMTMRIIITRTRGDGHCISSNGEHDNEDNDVDVVDVIAVVVVAVVMAVVAVVGVIFIRRRGGG